jgi:predicted glycosyltransferase
MATPLTYTGFIVPDRRGNDGTPGRRSPRIVVSAGGGVVGGLLLDQAVADQPEILATTGLRMRIITGPFVPDHVWARLEATARDRPGLELVRVAPDLAAELQRAQVSISQCGYNTALDLVRAKVPAVVVPHPDGGEQVGRALKLQERGLVRMVHPDSLGPGVLAGEVRALRDWRCPPCHLDLEGARKSLEIVRALDGERLRADCV